MDIVNFGQSKKHQVVSILFTYLVNSKGPQLFLIILLHFNFLCTYCKKYLIKLQNVSVYIYYQYISVLS